MTATQISAPLERRNRTRTFDKPDDPIVVIGGGYSGTITALELARNLPSHQPIVLCERNADPGTGVAYGTKSPRHLLNVRTMNMGALASQPEGFARWLESRGEEAEREVHYSDCGSFASRRIYGAYLRSLLRDACHRPQNPVRAVKREIVDCVPVAGGYEVVTSKREKFRARAVVLASGHCRRAPASDRRLVTDPWSEQALAWLDSTKAVLILGTGLTMFDIVLSLRERGFAGPILATSRHGLLPQSHRAAGRWTAPNFAARERQSVRRMMRRLREEIEAAERQGIDWQAVVDSIRPIVAEIWQGWSQAERARFLRHARHWWDVHRHRAAPPAALAISEELAAGRLQLLAGSAHGMSFDADAVRVSYRRRGDGSHETLVVQGVIVATGSETAKSAADPLMERLLQRRLIRLDPLGIGIDVTPQLEIVGANGDPRSDMWALGPLVRGMFWECTAVPDIRQQAERLAARVAAALGCETTTRSEASC